MSSLIGEGKIVCPFNKAHVILKARFATHIAKCQKNYPDVELVPCDFNMNHRIRRGELQYHHEHCPDKRVIEQNAYHQAEEVEVDRFPVKLMAPPVSDECWDDEIASETYNPSKHAEQKNVLRHIDVQPPSVRKHFKMEERQRHNKLEMENRGRNTEQHNKSTMLPQKPAAQPLKENIPEVTKQLLRQLDAGQSKAYIQAPK